MRTASDHARTDLAAELAAASHRGRAAGTAAMRFYGAARADEKAYRSPVTDADRAANRPIVVGIRAAFPGDAILSEEPADSGERRGAERVWIVDPPAGAEAGGPR